MKDCRGKRNEVKEIVDRPFFHAVSGEIIDLEKETEDSEYEIDQDFVFEKEAREIDEFVDICDKDKTFFKMWNEFMNSNQE